MNTAAELVDAVHARGGKMTPQRLLIFKMLEGNTSHPTAEGLYERVRQSMPMVSLTTVYKTLNDLVAHGDLKRFEVEGRSHFDPNTNQHGESICLKCGRIADVEQKVPRACAESGGFRVVSAALTFYGYCPDCLDAIPQVEHNHG